MYARLKFALDIRMPVLGGLLCLFIHTLSAICFVEQHRFEGR
jgi:hypothetical protein